MNEDSARTIDELVKFLNIGESSILEALKSLTGEGFVSEVGGKYYLNYSGTLRILTNYT